jgi:iron complex transport system permease protein
MTRATSETQREVGAAAAAPSRQARTTPYTTKTHRLSSAGYALLVFILIITLVFAMLLAISVGAVSIPLDVSWRVVLNHVLPGLVPQTWEAIHDQIIWNFRVPRAILAALVGAGLALVGTTLQALVRNPLADPYLLGVSAGASLGAVLVLVIGSAMFGGASLSAAAFMGALASLLAVYVMAQKRGRITPSRLVLAGVAVAYLFSAATNYVLLQARSGQAAQSVIFWLLGSVAGARWPQLPIPILTLVVGILLLIGQARPLNALLAGDEAAASLGVNLNRFRLQVVLITSLLTGVLVAVSGGIGFVGLMVPHLVRLVVGSDHSRVLPAVAISGAIFLVLVDLVARTVASPEELPLNIITALIGAPFFLWLLRRRDRSEAGALG